MSLRRRVVWGCVVVALVLVAADVALLTTFRGFLLSQVDTRLEEATERLVQVATRLGQQGPRRGGPPRGPLPAPGTLSDFFVGVTDAGGRGLGRLDVPLRPGQAPPQPAPERIVAAATRPGAPLRPFTSTGAADARWRLVALRPDGAAGIVVIGASLADVDPTYRRMVAVLLTATSAVLATLAGVAWWVLRQGVRPLTAMAATASTIAGGALGERVADTDPRTEAGRLAIALNTMLERIEAAFAQRAASEQRLRRFVADASHELRTPLTSIRGYAELYRRGALDDPDDLADAMRRVEQEGRRMGTLVDDLLVLAELDQGRPLELLPVDLAAVAADAVADLRAVDPDRPVSLRAEPVEVVGDDGRLRQAVGNLLTNVRVHTPAGTPVRVDLGREADAAVLEVADDGPGMPADVAARVLERFYRPDTGRARSSGGSGLGLSIVAAVAAAHGGEVEVDTAVGAGTRMRMRIPLRGPTPAAAAGPPAGSSTASRSPAP